MSIKRPGQSIDANRPYKRSTGGATGRALPSRKSSSSEQKRFDLLKNKTELPPELVDILLELSNPCADLVSGIPSPCLTRSNQEYKNPYGFGDVSCTKYCEENCIILLNEFLNELINKSQNLLRESKSGNGFNLGPNGRSSAKGAPKSSFEIHVVFEKSDKLKMISIEFCSKINTWFANVNYDSHSVPIESQYRRICKELSNNEFNLKYVLLYIDTVPNPQLVSSIQSNADFKINQIGKHSIKLIFKLD